MVELNFNVDIVNRLIAATDYRASIFLYGSRVYGSHTSKSDHDFQVVVPDHELEQVKFLISKHFNSRSAEVHLHSESEFLQALDDHKPWAVECAMLPPQLCFRLEVSTAFRLNKTKLRDEFARTASNSYVKCKKKLIVFNDFNAYVAKKSMFHSLRLLSYGTQLATQGRIYDWGSCNHHLRELMKLPDSWVEIEQIFKPIYNAAATTFRHACPKETK